MSDFEILECNVWSQENFENAIREKFPPPEYRVSSRKYRSDESCPPGAARAGLLFVVNGKCRCKFGSDEIPVVLGSGQYVNFPEGRYQIEPLEGKDAEIVFVWNVSKLFKEILSDKSGNSS
ncbi:MULTISPECIES: hypothetical protein [unclassified Variovorax]|jgi:hypothetical protein|uniref:hypothetical protein n=1 Tax=unclassified Variovorax TaxID=663243 RepID=UPI00131A7EDB|nr:MULTISPECIES: hypothetical protein [unclassified Variovorax]QRY31636.1 hypothetical protein JVX96_26895 [Variovorax sp. PDNC026]